MAKHHEGQTFTTNKSGKLLVVNYVNTKSVLVRFLDTGFEKTTSMSQINTGQVADPYARTVSGVGYLGEGQHTASSRDPHNNRKYHVWVDMIYRCYDRSCQLKNPSYVGTIVCDEWHNYQTFGDWYDNNYPGSNEELDKDILGCGKIYSPESCCFISKVDNVQESTDTRNTTWLFRRGHEVVRVTNLSLFAKSLGGWASNVHYATKEVGRTAYGYIFVGTV